MKRATYTTDYGITRDSFYTPRLGLILIKGWLLLSPPTRGHHDVADADLHRDLKLLVL